ncbi:Nn.00g032640.m01.CDS01 [Neocucurbitaria sp. VM-36]
MRVRVPEHLRPHEEAPISSSKDGNAIPTPASFCANKKLTKHVVPAGYGHAFAVKKGTRFRIVDLHGEQVVDFMAWVTSTPDSNATPNARPLPTLEKMSTAYTRYHLGGVAPAIGEALYSNADRPLLRITADTVKVHDMTFMSCFPSLYSEKGLHGHRSCAQNIFEVMKPYGMKDMLEIAEPFNCFQNTPNYSLKAMGSSKAGDFIEFEALEEVLCAVSCCPYDVDGFNGGVITDVAVVVSEEKE